MLEMNESVRKIVTQRKKYDVLKSRQQYKDFMASVAKKIKNKTVAEE